MHGNASKKKTTKDRSPQKRRTRLNFHTDLIRPICPRRRAVAITISRTKRTVPAKLPILSSHHHLLHEEGGDGGEGSQAEGGLEAGCGTGDWGGGGGVGWHSWAAGETSRGNGGGDGVGGVDDRWDALKRTLVMGESQISEIWIYIQTYRC